MAEEEPNVEAAQVPPEPTPPEAAPAGLTHAEPVLAGEPIAPGSSSPAPARRGTGRWIVNILLGLLIFACGAVTGAGVVARITWNRVAASLQHPDQLPANAAQRLSRVLKLDEKQTAEVKSILDRRFQTISALRREIAPRVDAELQSVHDEISAVLRPDQAKRWDRLFDTLRPRILSPGAKGKGPGRPARGQ